MQALAEALQRGEQPPTSVYRPSATSRSTPVARVSTCCGGGQVQQREAWWQGANALSTVRSRPVPQPPLRACRHHPRRWLEQF